MKTKQEYRVIDQEAWASSFVMYVTFEYNEKVYTAQSQYINGGWGLDDVEVYDDNRDSVFDEDVLSIGENLIWDMEINKDTITY